MDSPLLKIDNLSVSIDGRDILRNLRLEVPASRVVALLGSNGSGKSTLLRSVMGLQPAHGGKIFYHGVEISRTDTYLISRLGIGYLKQTNSVFPNLTVSENLTLALDPKEKLEFAGKWKYVEEIFPKLKKRAHARAGLLSGGERQMLALSMLLVKDFKLWLLDEPSAGLAPALVSQLLEAVRSLSRSLNVSVLLVEQNITAAETISDERYVLSGGTAQREYGRYRENGGPGGHAAAPLEQLRNAISNRDVRWVSHTLASASASDRKFALDMTYPIADQPPVRDALINMWSTETDPSVTKSLALALLDVDPLPPRIGREIFEWIADNLEVFKRAVARRHGGEEHVLKGLKAQVREASQAQPTDWARMCAALGSSRKRDAADFVRSFRAGGGEFHDEVKDYVLGRLEMDMRSQVVGKNEVTQCN